MGPIALAVISDLHFGKKARSKDLCPFADGPSLDEDFRQTFLRFVKENDLRADYLILPGDVAEGAHIEEVALASKFVRDAARALRVKLKNIVFVPGNHDVDWSVMAGGISSLRLAQRYDPLRVREHVFRRLVGVKNRNVLEEPYLALWKFDNFHVVGYNSSWHDNQTEAIHHGRIDPNHIAHLRTILADVSQSADVLRMFLVHHHPVAYDNPVPGGADFSQMVNIEQLLTVLREHYFDLFVHGHVHQPRFQVSQRDGGAPLGILSAGSFSLTLPSEWAGKITNQFHLINVHRRSAVSQYIEGCVNSWAYYFGHGWKPSTPDRGGIRHLESFGTHLDPHNCRSLLRTLIQTQFSSNNWVKWSTLVSVDPTLEYMRPERIDQSLNELSVVMGFQIHRNDNDTILLRN